MRLSIEKKHLKKLKTLFGNRLLTDPNELIFYSKDQSTLPAEVSLMVDTGPDAVVLPNNKDEVKRIIKWASAHKVPLTPRGGGTSAIFGSVPVFGGLVIDFRRMDWVLDLDEKNMIVTVEPGIVWEVLEKYLNERGYALLSYPSSAPSAMVAGWIAQGGIGIGSFEHGHVENTVYSLDVLLPNNELRSIHKNELKMVADCMGTTGIVVEVALKIRKNDPVVPFVAAFDDKDRFCAAIEDLRKRVPLWHLNWASPTFIRLQQKAAGHNFLPEGKWVVNGAMPSKRMKRYAKTIRTITIKHNGLLLGQDAADEEWAARFYPMRFSKLAPTLVPSEVYIPAKRLKDMIGLIEKKLRFEDLAYEGTFASKDESTVLAFIMDDERRAEFALAWGFSFAVVSLAKKLGGRVYQIGAFLPHMAGRHFGHGRLRSIQQFKADIDPDHILNPGKLMSKGALRLLPLIRLNVALASGQIPMAFMSRMFPHTLPDDGMYANKAIVKTAEKYDEAKPMDVRQLYNCISCGYCNQVCPVYKVHKLESHSPRGRIFALKKLVSRTRKEQEGGEGIVPNKDYVDTMYCTLCYKCQTVCHVDIEFIHLWNDSKVWATNNGLVRPKATIDMYDNVHDVQYHNPFKEPKEKRSEWYKDDYKLPEKADVVYFKGCMDSYYEYKTLKNVMKIFTAAGLEFTTLGTDEMCCGAPLEMAGLTKRSAEIARHNVEAIRKRDAKLVVTACPGCLRALHHYKKVLGEQPFEIKHVVEVIDGLMKEGKIEFKKSFKKGPIIYHDPCELGRVGELEGRALYEEPRALLKKVPGVDEILEFNENRRSSSCCGGGGIMKAIDIDVSQKIGLPKVEEADEKGAATIVSACPSCNATFAVLINMVKANRKSEGKKFKMGVSDVCDVVAKAI